MKKSLAVGVIIAGVICLIGPFVYECISILILLQQPGQMLCSPLWLAALTKVVYNPLWIILAIVGVILILYGRMFLKKK